MSFRIVFLLEINHEHLVLADAKTENAWLINTRPNLALYSTSGELVYETVSKTNSSQIIKPMQE